MEGAQLHLHHIHHLKFHENITFKQHVTLIAYCCIVCRLWCEPTFMQWLLFCIKIGGTCALPTKLSNYLPTWISQIMNRRRTNIHPTRHHVFIHTDIAFFMDLSMFVKKSCNQTSLLLMHSLSDEQQVSSDLWEETEGLVRLPKTHLPS